MADNTPPRQGTISVNKFATFQHYKDRNPPWIKLHASTLDHYEFSHLKDAQKYHLMALWVLASKHDNAIPLDLEWITKRIGATEPVELQPLVDAGFITIERRLHDASKPQARRKRAASEAQAKCSPRREEERRVEERFTGPQAGKQIVPLVRIDPNVPASAPTGATAGEPGQTIAELSGMDPVAFEAHRADVKAGILALKRGVQ